MGNTPSQAGDYPVGEEEVRQAPHNFYLVYGHPSIRYNRDRVRGPLLYDVEVEYDEDADAVEHTATLDLTSAVPRRQKFELIPPPPLTSYPAEGTTTAAAAGTPGGLALTFRVAANTPPRRIRVLTNVSIEYKTGHGIRLGSSDAGRPAPRCIFQTTSTADLTTVVTLPKVNIASLRPVVIDPVLHATATTTTMVQRVSSAPLVIEVEVGEAVDPMRSPRRSTTAKGNSAISPSSASGKDSGATPQGALSRVVQYTLLEAPAAPAAGMERLSCTVSKQLLQVGSDVYELEDVFDVEQTDVAPNPEAVNDDDGMCAVCFTNPKNTTILPCRHMCLCNECAAHVQLTSNRCPLCRGNIERLMTL